MPIPDKEIDFASRQSDPNTVLYGHNMKNGSMFAGLHKFAAYEYSDAHLLLTFDFTDEEVYQSYLDAI